jgi:hypothetical protein
MFSLNDMREEALPKHARSWHVSQGSSRVFPVRRDPSIHANGQMPGGVSRFPGPFALRAAAAVCLLFIAFASAAWARPTGPEPIGLGGGRLGDYLWTVQAVRQEGAAGRGPGTAQKPCLVVGTKWQVGPYNYRRSRNRECAGATELTASGPPLTAAGAQPSTGATPRLTAVGMIFAPAARRAQVVLAGGRSMTIDLRRLSPASAHDAGLERFRYAAFAVHGRWCVERIVSEGARGRVLWDSGVDPYTCVTE